MTGMSGLNAERIINKRNALEGQVVRSKTVLKVTIRGVCGELVPKSQNRAHCQVADELVGGVYGEKLHALFCEKGAGELHSGDEAEPEVETHCDAEVQVLNVKDPEKQANGEG